MNLSNGRDLLIRDCAAFLGLDVSALADALGVQPSHLYKVKSGKYPLSDKMRNQLITLITHRYQTYDPEPVVMSLLWRLGVGMDDGSTK